MADCVVVEDYSQPRTPGSVRIVCISDTHGIHEIPDLPPGDILLHGGDLTFLGRDESDMNKFNALLESAKHLYKDIIVIAGNHDMLLDEKDGNRFSLKRGIARLYFGQLPRWRSVDIAKMKSLMKNCVYLEDSFVVCHGLKIYGAPWVPNHFDLGFNLKRGEALREKWDLIPSDTDILITHGPPHGHRDEVKPGVHLGCSDLRDTITSRLNIQLHLFGHIHEGYGVTKQGNTIFANAAVCDAEYKLSNPPLVFDVFPRLKK